MGVIHNAFSTKIRELWDLAHRLDKPRSTAVTWTTGIVPGRANYEDLQAHFLALAASIIVCEETVPEIICAWDSPAGYTSPHAPSPPLGFPRLLADAVKAAQAQQPTGLPCLRDYVLQTKYVSLLRAWLSINAWPPGLGRGYRAKWGGLRYVTTKYGILSDADTICLKPCVDYLLGLTTDQPDVFCWTSFIGPWRINVGLCLFDMHKLNAFFFPLLSRIYWRTNRKDSTLVQAVRKAFPESIEQLKLGLSDKRRVNAEKHAPARATGHVWNPEVMHYHAWKGEFRQGGQRALDDYGDMLDQLILSAKTQLGLVPMRR
jgi:hypothetical protein